MPQKDQLLQQRVCITITFLRECARVCDQINVCIAADEWTDIYGRTDGRTQYVNQWPENL